MEQESTSPGFPGRIKNKINAFLHNKNLKEKLYIIIFESDTPKGKLFDVFLIGFIIASVLVVILESVVTFSDRFKLILQILEYVSNIWCGFIVALNRRNIYSAFSELWIYWLHCLCILAFSLGGHVTC